MASLFRTFLSPLALVTLSALASAQDTTPKFPFQDNAVAYHVGVYLFQCLHCKTYTILWDCD